MNTINIVIIGHTKSGKTLLVEKLLNYFNDEKITLNNNSTNCPLVIKLNNNYTNKFYYQSINYDLYELNIMYDLNHIMISNKNKICNDQIIIELFNKNLITFYDLPGYDDNHDNNDILLLYDKYINLKNVIIICILPASINSIKSNILLNYIHKNNKEKNTILVFSKCDELQEQNIDTFINRLNKNTDENNLNEYNNCIGIINKDNEQELFNNILNNKYSNLKNNLTIEKIYNIINYNINKNIIKKLADKLYLNLIYDINIHFNSYIKLRNHIFISNNFRHHYFYNTDNQQSTLENINNINNQQSTLENIHITDNNDDYILKYNNFKINFINNNELLDEYKEYKDIIIKLIYYFDKEFEFHFKILESEILKFYICLYYYNKNPYDSDYENLKDYDFERVLKGLRILCIKNTINILCNNNC